MKPEAQPHDALIGTILAERYQIEQRIGAGAMGAVYKARHIKVGRPFAVKLLHANLLDDKKTAQRFEREAELAGRLRHVNVIGVIDVGETADGIRYMVMDFAEGEDLAGLLSEAPMPAPRIVNLVRQMLEGLWHAHEHGLIHRDFKPENVIVERDANGLEVPRIVDFGIAILHDAGASVDADGRLTTNGLVLGTPHYMAPEQAVSDPLDHRVDLFALGLVIYEMLCGKLPFDGSGAEVARANLMLEPPRISDRVAHLEVDPLLEAFSRRLMAKRRDHRPATARAARELLDLIERDPEAAAAELGVPLDVERGPKRTAPSTPIPGAMTERDLQPQLHPVATPPQAPPMQVPVAIHSQRDLRTSVADPLEFEPARRGRGRLIAMIAGGVVAAGVVTVLVAGRSEPRPVQTALVIADSAGPEITPIEPKPIDPKPIDPKPIDPKPTKPIDPRPADAKPVDPKPVATKPVPSTIKPAKPVEPKPVEPKPADPKPVAEIKHPDPAPKPAPVEIGKETVTAAYKAAGAAIKTLEDKKGAGQTHDLWERYRRYQIFDALATPQTRANAYEVYSGILRDVKTRLR